MEVNTIYAANREEWRAWLQVNHASEPDIWLIFYKKHTGKPSVTIEEAIEEGLCFGWVDSVMRSIDGERYMLRFTPRKPKSNWSEYNKHRAKKLIAEGRMTEAGLAKVTFPLEDVSPGE